MDKKETNHSKSAATVHGDISKEKTALDENKQKLMDFRATPAFQELTPEHQQLLERQATAMDGYSQVLGQRISIFERDNPELAPKPKAEPKGKKEKEEA
jgi:hypothetical protein